MRLLYHLPLSPFSRKVRLVLSERRLPFELKVERVWERRPEFLSMHAAGTVPVLVEDNGLVIPDSSVICEYLEEAYPDTALLGRTLGESVEIRRLVAWFDGKFAAEVTRNLIGEKHMKHMFGRGHPDVALIRAGYANLRGHLEYIGWLAEQRRWLAGNELSLADFAAAAHLSSLDFAGEVDWSMSPPAKEWYSKMKSRPSFRPLLTDRVTNLMPPSHYADLDFLSPSLFKPGDFQGRGFPDHRQPSKLSAPFPSRPNPAIRPRMSGTISGLSFEDALAELERIVRGLEGGQQKLEDAITCYERGTALRRHCEAKLAEAEARVQAIVERADGSLSLKDVAAKAAE